MDGIDDAWAELGLAPGADRAAVRRAFRRLAHEHHPDHGGDRDRFERVSAAAARLLEVAPPAPLRATGAAAPGRDPYRRFLTGLDQAARLRVAPRPTPCRRSGPGPAPRRVPARPFADVLADVLAEALAAA